MKLFCIFITLLLCVYADGIENEAITDIGEDNSLPPTFSESDVSRVDHAIGFKWAWETQRYSENYERLKGKPWLEAANLWEISGSFTHRREHDDQDNYFAIGYASFRPFVYDFGNASIAFGVSTILRYTKISDFDPKAVQAEVGGVVIDAVANQVKTEAYQQVINFSALLSIPEAGLQVIFDIGYGYSNLRQTIDPIDASDAGLILDEYQYQQRDRGFFAGVNFLKSFDRPYFDYIRLFVYGAYRDVTDQRDSTAVVIAGGNNLGKQNLEQPVLGLDLDPQLTDESNLSFVAYQLYLRLFTIHTPLTENRGISVSFFNQMVYTSFELLGEDFHGAQWKYGAQIGLFDGLNVRMAFVDETGGGSNARQDGWEISVSIQLSGLIRALLQ
ncbi:hypothetical protein [Candidatus Uabimicrobium sp. HlEnr_7]|uniref:hypothetical protein n=1 Tax=Candidatus Uabimicrobium helgolandensis TaxID=3095367 RepID=UPI0035564096